MSITGLSTFTGTTLPGDGASGMEEAIALLFINDQVMFPYYTASIERMGLAEFQKILRQLIRKYAIGLKEEAHSPLQNGTASLVRRRAETITNGITNLISSTDGDKVAAMSRLKDQETTTIKEKLDLLLDERRDLAMNSRPVHNDLAEVLDDVEERDEDDDPQQTDETELDSVALVKEFLTCSNAFQRLRDDVRILAFPSTRDLIRMRLYESGVFSNKRPTAEVTCRVAWEVLKCCEVELDNEFEIPSAVTITGHPMCAQAASCEDYMRQTWPRTGEAMMKGFIAAVVSSGSEQRLGREHQIKISMVPASEELALAERADVHISGPPEALLESLEQLAWLAATFRLPMDDCLASSFVGFECASKSSSNSPAFDLTLLALRREHSKSETQGLCWVPVFRASILARGFPISAREDCAGLDIPFPLMVYLTGVNYPVENGSGLLLQSRGDIHSKTTHLLIPIKKVKESVQWHYLETSSHASLLNDEVFSFLGRSDDPEAWFQTRDLEKLISFRSFLGYCSFAEVRIGTSKFSDEAVQESDLPATCHEFTVTPEGTVGVTAAAASFFSATIKARYTIRRGLRATIPGQELDFQGRLLRAAEQPLLLYDCAAHRAWLVPELSVALQLTHAFLAKRTLSATIREKVKFAVAAADGGRAAKHAVERCSNVVLWEEQGVAKHFGEIVTMFLDIMESRKSLSEDRSVSLSLRVPALPRRYRGWNYTDLRDMTHLFRQRELTSKHEADRSWWGLTKSPTMLVLFGENFGQVIAPDRSRAQICSAWTVVPPSKGTAFQAAHASQYKNCDISGGGLSNRRKCLNWKVL
ncbi:hypothetical protein MBLNU459_g7266t1 [Dothideomycetes sp. NU459]